MRCWLSRIRKTVPKGVSLLIVSILFVCSTLAGQNNADYVAKKKQAYDLLTQNKMVESEKAFEDLSSSPEAQSDFDIFAKLGFLLFGKMSITTDEQQRKDFADRARVALTRAKELGDQNSVSIALLAALKDGPPPVSHFSDVSEANLAMQEAELLYVTGDLATAVTFYQKALAADPKLYEAALDIGDCDFKIPGKLDEAPQWFAKAVAINPNRETAYRYWADALVKLRKPEEARDKFVDAYISEPGNGIPVGALMGWAKGEHIIPAHPRVNVPVKVEHSGDENKITLDAGSTAGPGLAQWIVYGGERVQWAKKFAQEYPNETTYRHSLKEEAAALRAAIAGVEAGEKNLDPSIVTLIKLEQDGVLEAYILLARADNGIAQDYAGYLREHRELLRRYVVEWVLTNGGTQKSVK